MAVTDGRKERRKERRKEGRNDKRTNGTHQHTWRNVFRQNMGPQSESATIQFSKPEIIESTDGKVLRITAELIGYGSDDVIVRPAESRLLLLSKDDVILSSYNLPESVDPFTVQAVISESGVLMVQAPLQC